MFSKKKSQVQPGASKGRAIPSIISQDVFIQGHFQSDGAVQLDGRIEGEIKVHALTLGQTGEVTGSIEADSVTIKGRLDGSVTARQVIIEKSAQIKGDIFHTAISIESGAQVEGQIKQFDPNANITKIDKSAKNHSVAEQPEYIEAKT